MTEAPPRPKARAPRGFLDRRAGQLATERRILEAVARVYERYGFEPLETGAFEYADALGKFLPDADRPNEGVFALQDDDERVDGAALRPHRAAGPVRRRRTGSSCRSRSAATRSARSGATRSRGLAAIASSSSATPTPSARRGPRPTPRSSPWRSRATPRPACRAPPTQLKINNRKLLNGLLTAAGVERDGQKLAVLRAVDKLDRLGPEGVKLLLGAGRQGRVRRLHQGRGASAPRPSTRCWPSSPPAQGARAATLDRLANVIGGSAEGDEGLAGAVAHRRGAGRASASARTRRCSTRRWCAGSSTTPARCSRPSCWPRAPTSAASRSASARSAAAGATTTWWRASPASGRRRPASRSASRAWPRRWRRRGRADEAETRGPVVVIAFDQARMGDYFAARRRAARRRRRRRGLSRRVRHAGADALRRPAALARRGDPRRATRSPPAR